MTIQGEQIQDVKPNPKIRKIEKPRSPASSDQEISLLRQKIDPLGLIIRQPTAIAG